MEKLALQIARALTLWVKERNKNNVYRRYDLLEAIENLENSLSWFENKDKWSPSEEFKAGIVFGALVVVALGAVWISVTMIL